MAPRRPLVSNVSLDRREALELVGRDSLIGHLLEVHHANRPVRQDEEEVTPVRTKPAPLQQNLWWALVDRSIKAIRCAFLRKIAD